MQSALPAELCSDAELLTMGSSEDLQMNVFTFGCMNVKTQAFSSYCKKITVIVNFSNWQNSTLNLFTFFPNSYYIFEFLLFRIQMENVSNINKTLI